MKIIIINGSPRKNGATAKILRAMKERLLEQKDSDVEYIELGNLDITTCTGCCSCYKTGSCFMADDAEMLSGKIAGADGVIIGSPTYASNISGMLKQFVDRGHFVIEQLLYNKYAISVATGENYGNGDTSKILGKLLKYSGARLSGRIICTVPFNGNPLSDGKLERKIRSLTNKMCDDIRKKKTYPTQDLVRKLIFRIGIFPFVMRKGEAYDAVVSRWKTLQIIK